jgi:anti-anti-sigma factor
VNLDELEYIDSSGLSALVRIWMKASESGTQLVLSCGNPRIYRILEITGLLNLFKVVSIGGEPAMAAGLGYTQLGIMRE